MTTKPYVVYYSETRHGKAEFSTKEEAEAWVTDDFRDLTNVDWYPDSSKRLTVKEKLY